MRSDVQQTSTTSTRLHKEILCAFECIGIWHGSHTLTGRRTKHFKHIKISLAPSSLLFHNLYYHRKKLQHLQMQTPSHYQSHHPLETIPHLNQRTLHYHYQSCQLTILVLRLQRALDDTGVLNEAKQA